MKPIEYIPRTVLVDGNEIDEHNVDFSSGVKIVLAEPGGGKTRFLQQIAARLGVSSVRASIFRHQKNTSNQGLLVLDAMDEVSRLDRSALDEIIVKAEELGPQVVIFASRASEWDNSSTKFVEDCFDSQVQVLRLQPFTVSEQQRLFADLFPTETFEDFHAEVEKFELLPLLSNPQFLFLFANAYVEAERRFSSKQSIFDDALKKLSSEHNLQVPQSDRTPTQDILACADEVFAKLLLSGADGVSRSEATSDANYPYLGLIYNLDTKIKTDTLSSALFKQGPTADQFEPVHKIVAEYAAARYFVRRINDPTDFLRLERIQSVIAPNGVVRDELRGMLGWMAALGSVDIQSRLIETDPYAVMSNGDPSQLHSKNKKLLLRNLTGLSDVDPYFRRGDGWRSFSVAGFFDDDIIEEIRVLLKNDSSEQLRRLLLELLVDAPLSDRLFSELREIAINSNESFGLRKRASQCFSHIENSDLQRVFDALMLQGNKDALKLLSFLVERFGPATFSKAQLKRLMHAIADLYPSDRSKIEWEIGSRHFVRSLIQSFDVALCTWLLNELTNNLHCTCNSKRTYDCVCRIGVSKVVGQILDRYCDLQCGPLSPKQLWGWTKNLVFHTDYNSDRSSSVNRFQEDTKLRRAVHKLAFSTDLDTEQAWDMAIRFRFRDQFHAGWTFDREDLEAVVDWAFENDLAPVWTAFHRFHNRHADEKKSQPLRRKMRVQSRDKVSFLSAWSSKERKASISAREDDKHHQKHIKKMRRRRLTAEQRTVASFKAHKDKIRAGQHWPWLKHYADDLLSGRERDTENLGDEDFRREALLNCIPFLEPHIPNLKECAERKADLIVRVLYAVCLLWLEKHGNLVGLPKKALLAVRSDLPAGYDAVSEELANELKHELNKRVFATNSDKAYFLREFVGTQLSQGRSVNAVWLLDQPEFQPLKKEFAYEWITKFPNAEEQTIRHLFEALAATATPTTVLRVIRERCEEYFSEDQAEDEEQNARRLFWALRSFYFEEAPPVEHVEFLLGSRDHIFVIAGVGGSFRMDDHPHWPKLSPDKILLVLSAFISDWPPVALPNSYGTGSPATEQAYRFLTELVWNIGHSDGQTALPVLDKLLSTPSLEMFETQAKVMRSQALKEIALKDFTAPSCEQVIAMLDSNQIATVEDLRALILLELAEFQRWIFGGATDPITMFHTKRGRVDENTATKRIAERLQERFKALGISVLIEQRMPNEKRCDLTATVGFRGDSRTLVVEAKGQWHKDLFDAPKEQLNDLYAIYPDAAHQGVYLAYWFGKEEKIAGLKNEDVLNASQLAELIRKGVPEDLSSLIDVFVLDLSIPAGFNLGLLN